MKSPQYFSYRNGVEADPQELQVPAFGPLALWGEGSFDTFRVYEGRILFPAPHRDRLSNSCKGLWGARPDLDAAISRTWASLETGAQQFQHARGRLLVAPTDAQRTRFDVFGELAAFEPLSDAAYAQGVSAGFSRYTHPGLGLWGKNPSAIWSRMAAEEAKERALDEVILCRESIVVEAAWSAIVWKEGEEWRTPAPSLNAMPSTTLAALKAQGLPIENVVATRERLTYADAIVLVSAVRLAMGLNRLEGRTFSDPDRAAAPLRELLLRA